MPYVPDADDVTQPVITQFASSAALEFTTLKTKINRLFLSSSFNDTDNTVGFFRGSTWINQGSGPNTLVAIDCSATRTGGTASVIAGTASAVLGNNVNLDTDAAAIGMNMEMWTSETNSLGSSVGGIFGGLASIVQQNPAGQAWSKGLEIRFFNRAPATAATLAGLGTDLYNKNAVGLVFSSQPRGTEGAKCGWVAGIRFENYALDQDSVGTLHPTAIDFTGLGLTNAAIEPVHFNISGLRMISTASDNTGSVAAPTTYQGFIRISIDGGATFGIPVCGLPL